MPPITSEFDPCNPCPPPCDPCNPCPPPCDPCFPPCDPCPPPCDPCPPPCDPCPPPCDPCAPPCDPCLPPCDPCCDPCPPPCDPCTLPCDPCCDPCPPPCDPCCDPCFLPCDPCCDPCPPPCDPCPPPCDLCPPPCDPCCDPCDPCSTPCDPCPPCDPCCPPPCDPCCDPCPPCDPCCPPPCDPCLSPPCDPSCSPKDLCLPSPCPDPCDPPPPRSFCCQPCDPELRINSCTFRQRMLVIAVMAVVLVAAATAILGAVAFFTCIGTIILDTWLFIQGITTLGACVGLMIWSSKYAHGRLINGPRILAILLITINFAWLIYGNMAIGFAYTACAKGGKDLLGEDIPCGTSYLQAALALIIFFDIAYLGFFITVGVVACCYKNKETWAIPRAWALPGMDEGGCCFRPHCLTFLTCLPKGNLVSWQEGVIGSGLVVYVLLSIGALVSGSIFVSVCDEWYPLWLVVYGTVAVFTVILLSVLILCPLWISVCWSRGLLVFLPVLLLLQFQFIWIVYGNAQLWTTWQDECVLGVFPIPVATCTHSLELFATVFLVFLTVPIVTLLYVGVVFFLLMAVLFMVTSCCYCCPKNLEETEMNCVKEICVREAVTVCTVKS